ncbi:bifunctional diaminohydroxyphosphoribosylaminopyrimidine deaminase/5-amino-6-(5-phosphoribosylamino)uracil reductase RibD [Fuchsiella alkaliacetigena]|uniref:bifunctional diaminohydroxyphosphoribosylaminopyrimidine deaminase/5-amino-6-(5-phosphoribosylamino)uracil reductase RibD n=1 Tax=Fuchsiella alkaliacetigena TaxID=957042 RepID=UPI00200AA81B|nr:bifunctional diaminohydroxyphosphoribosylaminopyrimidine deaminase/5-amino-6-(5-phosphoribosylamino)uracil reductase RibD [Fuchsiella alkaliacetigena]MCK8823610.1 bifunctional diaminohydroxyphosphoribosylaminopyrimidine deaminase/5-amino-6-(5-phosphoribosylamino)uracil reductase RibD [Fuchsiella alkaliacetigena]
MTDSEYMELALQLAARGRGRTSPNPMVGAVIVKDNEIIGQGYHQAAGEAHAEVNALAEAGAEAQGATVYVNLEPCSHQGRTPPCTEALIEAQVSRVVVAMQDPNPQVAGRGLDALQAAGIEVESGLLAEEAKQLNEAFIKYITTGYPFVISKGAMTLDGKIATRTGDSKWISCEQSRQYTHYLRDEVDAILVGIGTVLADDPRLTARLPDREGRDPLRIVLDSTLKIPEQCNLVTQESSAKTVVVTTAASSFQKRMALKEQGVEIWQLGDCQGAIDLEALLVELGKREIMQLLIEGGSEVNYSFLAGGLVDKLMYFIAPKLIGGREAVSIVGGRGIEKIEQGINIDKLQVEQLGEDLLITGYPQ